MHARLLALHQHLEARRLELGAAHVVEARVRHVEARVDALHQWVMRVHHAVREHAPALEAEVAALLVIAKLFVCVCRVAGAKRRGDVIVGPIDDLDERLPERFEREVGLGDIGAGDDQRVQAVGLDPVETLVILLDVRTAFWSARELIERERVHIALRDLIALAHQPKKQTHRNKKHHNRQQKKQTKKQNTYVLLQCGLARHHGAAFFLYAFENKKTRKENKKHVVTLVYVSRIS